VQGSKRLPNIHCRHGLVPWDLRQGPSIHSIRSYPGSSSAMRRGVTPDTCQTWRARTSGSPSSEPTCLSTYSRPCTSCTRRMRSEVLPRWLRSSRQTGPWREQMVPGSELCVDIVLVMP